MARGWKFYSQKKKGRIYREGIQMNIFFFFREREKSDAPKVDDKRDQYDSSDRKGAYHSAIVSKLVSLDRLLVY